ncbi:LysR substrate-binding domain-containing protein [Novosphingobium sp.]|uniref:LysR substrate-binding domain-containing protein n=1 Tax=Novosphingobium sp. TaxID=1874826 RepID=UPI003D14BE22
MAVCAPGFLDPDRFLADPADLIENEASDRQWYSWADWFARAGLPARPGLAPALRFNHYTDAIEAARAGQGVALGWHMLCERYLDDRSLVRLGDREVAPDGMYNVLLPLRREPDPAAGLAAQWLPERLAG